MQVGLNILTGGQDSSKGKLPNAWYQRSDVLQTVCGHLILTLICVLILNTIRDADSIMHKISVKDFPNLDLVDKRFIKIIENTVRHPGTSIPQHSDRWYDTKATYERFKKEGIALDSFGEGIDSYGASHLKESRVLAIHESLFCLNNSRTIYS